VTPARKGVVFGVKNQVNVLFELLTGTNNVQERPAYNLALVMDKSGSMAGKKLDFAKIAVKKVIESLSSKDMVHLICYDTKVTVPITCGIGGDGSLHKIVDKIDAGTSTNISGGLEKAVEVLQQSKGPVNKRIFLFSDGLANCGVSSNEGLFEIVENIQQGGCIVSAYGIGDDFSESLMKGIAETGRGDYAFIDAEEHIPKYVRHGLRSILSCIGTNGILKLRGRNGAIVQTAYGYDDDDLIRGLRLDDIREENRKQILCVIDVSASEGSIKEGVHPVLDWELSYKPAENPLSPFITLSGSMGMVFTSKSEVALSESEGSVKVQVAMQIQEAASKDRQVLELIDAGKIDDAAALKETSLTQLALWEPKDSTGFITSILKRGRNTLSEIRSKKNVAKMRKFVDYEADMGDRMSACSITFDASLEMD